VLSAISFSTFLFPCAVRNFSGGYTFEYGNFTNSPAADERIIKSAPTRGACFGPSEALPPAVRTGGVCASFHASGIPGS
jgi:hypothetical protein